MCIDYISFTPSFSANPFCCMPMNSYMPDLSMPPLFSNYNCSSNLYNDISLTTNFAMPSVAYSQPALSFQPLFQPVVNFCSNQIPNFFSSFSFPSLNLASLLIPKPNFNLVQPSVSSNVTLTSFPTITAKTSTTLNQTNRTYKIGKFDLDFWKSQGYNHEKGIALAMDAVSTCPGHADGQCVGYTRKTINRIYGTNFKRAGAGYLFGQTILSKPELRGKFKKVDPSLISKAGVPDGAILLWKPGSPGYTKGKAALYGHGAIAYQNKAYADCVVRNLSTCYEVWIPV